MSNIYIKGLASGNVSISGDEGLLNVNVSTDEIETVEVGKVVGNILFCDTCAAFITAGKISARLGNPTTGHLLSASEMESIKSGTIFDLDDNLVVDSAEGLEFVVSTQVDNADSPYSILAEDKVLEVDTSGGAVSLLLPAGVDGKQYRIKDLGNAGVANITLTPHGAETIDGGGAVLLTEAYAVLDIYFRTAAGWLSV